MIFGIYNYIDLLIFANYLLTFDIGLDRIVLSGWVKFMDIRI